MQNIGVWDPSTWEDCMQKTDKAPITTKWVDVDKGRDGEVLMRSRLVARDFKNKNDGRSHFGSRALDLHVCMILVV